MGMISKREGQMDRAILMELRDPEYIKHRRDAWRRCLQMRDRQNQRVNDYPWWTAEWERQTVADAEVEGARARERRLELDHAQRLAQLRKPPARETGEPSQIRRIK
jgi:hypothetical protein